MTDAKFSPQEKLRCALRELGYRKRVFPRLVLEGKMTEEVAERQIELMRDIVGDYRSWVRDEQPDLFGRE